MPETVTLNEKLGVIEVRTFGDVTTEDIANAEREVERIQGETGIDKVLADSSGQASLPETTDMFQVASAIPKSRRIAVLISEGQPTEDDVLFSESIALSCGALYRVFYSKEEALDWLTNP